MNNPEITKPRVLFLPKWYPHRYDPMPGLFIQRQAEALTPFCDVAVIYVHPDRRCNEKVEVEFSEENNVRVLRVYYRQEETGSSFLAKIQAFRVFRRAYEKAIDSIREFRPDLIHAHILTRVGFIAMKEAAKMNIPFLISEHWSRYFPENATYQGYFRKFITGKVCRNASAVIAVSEKLRDAMIHAGITHRQFLVVPNVVDAAGFAHLPRDKSHDVATMIHVSCFDDRSKNISGLLRSLSLLAGKGIAFRCLMVGEGPDLVEMQEYARFLRFDEDTIRFTGLKTGPDLAQQMAEADFAVVSSRYETFGTVIVESLAAGLPVVSTNVGIAPEVIDQSNGILIPPGDDESLAGALETMIGRIGTYDRQAIRNRIDGQFSSESVGTLLFDIYQMVLTKKR